MSNVRGPIERDGVRIESTSDVSIEALKSAATLLPAEWKAEVEESQVFMRSMEVPSWVSVLAGAPWWLQALAAGATAYISGIISEAGKDTWRNRNKALCVIKETPAVIRKFAEFLLSAQASGNGRTFVVLAIPFPDEYNTAHLRLVHQNLEELEFLVCLFVYHLPALQFLIKAEGLESDRPVGEIRLEFGDDCSLLVSWLDRASLDRRDRVLPFKQGIHPFIERTVAGKPPPASHVER